MGSTASTANRDELLTAAMSAIIGVELQSSIDPSTNPQKVCLFNYHDKTYSYGPVGSRSVDSIVEDETDNITVFVKTLTGQTIICCLNSTNTVADLKLSIKNKENVPTDRQRIIFAGRQLDNQQRLCDCHVHDECTVHLVVRADDAEDSSTVLDASSMDPRHDCDFTNVRDRNASFTRGGMTYLRPCGWRRFAIKVSGRFENLVWLRCTNGSGEWPVSYHGTGQHQGKTIAMDGYELTKEKEFSFKYGVYSTPDIKVAQKYATKFSYNGANYLIVLQNRVNPETLQKIPGEQTDLGEYWISPSSKDVRPYGICIRRV